MIDKETPSRGEPVWQDETWFMWDGDVMVGELQREVAPRVVTPETWDKPDGIVYSGQFYVYQPDSFEPRAMQRYQQIAEAEDGEIAPLGEEQIYFYQNDPNGMPIRLQDGEGEVVWEAQFTPFGQLSVTGTSQLRQPLRMQGQYYDTESGLHYNRYRYYDPACGVFISQDPIGLKGGLNPYQFAVNTLGWVDPLGLWKNVEIMVSLRKNLGVKNKSCNSAHGNSHDTDKPAEGYTLRDRDFGDVTKYGETTQGEKRYSQKYLDENNVDMFFEASGSKKDMHAWQHENIKIIMVVYAHH